MTNLHVYGDFKYSQNLLLPPRIYPLFKKLYATLPQSTPPSQNLSNTPRIYPSLPEYTPFSKNYMRPSHNLPLPPRIYPSLQQLYAILPESTPPS